MQKQTRYLGAQNMKYVSGTESKMNALPLVGFLPNDDIFICFHVFLFP